SFRSPCSFSLTSSPTHRHFPSFPTRRSSDLAFSRGEPVRLHDDGRAARVDMGVRSARRVEARKFRSGNSVSRHEFLGELLGALRSEEHTSELQSRFDLVCRLLLEKKKTRKQF